MSDVGGADLDVHLAAAARGDQDAMNHILRIITPLVVRYCRSRLGRARSSYQSADDIAQEVCLAVALALPRYHEQGRPFLAYVYRIAANKVVDAHRAETRRRFDPAHPPAGPTGSSTRPDQVEDDPRLRLVDAARALSESLLDVLDLDAGLAEATRADHLGRSPADPGEPSRPVGGGTDAGPPRATWATGPTRRPTRPGARRSTALPTVAPWTDAPPPHLPRRPLPVETEQCTFPKPEDHALHLESVGWARELLDLLPERQREIVILRVVNGFSAEETAEALGSSPGAIRVAQHRALGHLRRALAGGAFRSGRAGLGAGPEAVRGRPLAG
jgi:RNA polymerase sigma-70 factor (ECF subfamily)